MLCHINLPHTYTEHRASRDDTGGPDTKQMKQGEMEELGMEKQPPDVVIQLQEWVNIWSVCAGRWLDEEDVRA